MDRKKQQNKIFSYRRQTVLYQKHQTAEIEIALKGSFGKDFIEKP